MSRADDVTIRRFRDDELDDLVEVQNQIFSDYLIPIRSSKDFFLDFQRSVGGKLGNIHVAESSGRMVGYVNPVLDGDEAWIGGVGVIPERRRQGVASRLMSAAECFARENGARKVSLEVIEGNMRAEKMYERLGYRRTRKFVTAEGKPVSFAGFGEHPAKASMAEVLSLHERSYNDTCWQRRKLAAIVQPARTAERYTVDGGFVLVRSIETTGFIPFLGVVPEKRGLGIGTSLAKFALNRLFELGAFKATVYNVNEDEPTMRLLDKFDFKVTLKQSEMVKDLGRKG